MHLEGIHLGDIVKADQLGGASTRSSPATPPAA
jgi:hypothetical protein